MTKSYLLDLLSVYTKDLEDIPSNRYYETKKYYFLYDVYIKWSMEMIEEYLMKSKNYSCDGLMVLEELAHKMDTYACQAKTDDAKFIFSTAYDVVTDFIGFAIMEDGGF